jgi:glycosyltransferase involved in cell wall biosynthesis
LGHVRPPRVCVACPDARPPAYEAAAGLATRGALDTFVTAYYHIESGPLARTLEHLPRGRRWLRRLSRRMHPAIPPAAVVARPSVDLCLAAENRVGSGPIRRLVARRRTQGFDRSLARHLDATRPEVAFLFSDVGSAATIDRCRRLGIPTVLSVVHGDIDEEAALLERQRREAPEYYPLYLGDGRLDEAELGWLHERRRREARLADLLLVPSEHIAARLRGRGIAGERIRVVPYAADLGRFQPRPRCDAASGCTFVFAGGITQRKGISYLLDAWAHVRRDDWRLRLIGPLPSRLGPLAERLKTPGVEVVGRVGHAEMAAALTEGDVFVFPSLFEGSAVVTYEAMACGLPLIVTAEAGSVARDGVEALIVPPADTQALAGAMRRMGEDAGLRSRLGAAARQRVELFSWARYQAEVAHAVGDVARR